MKQLDLESTDWASAHVRSYLDGTTDIEGFWQPMPEILAFYTDFPSDPNNRLPYFWQLVGIQAMTIARLGHTDAEADFRIYLKRWLDALQRSDSEWAEIVQNKGRPLDDNDPDWDSP